MNTRSNHAYGFKLGGGGGKQIRLILEKLQFFVSLEGTFDEGYLYPVPPRKADY